MSAAAVVALAAGHARADLSARVSARLAHSDNVELAPAGFERGDQIVDVATGIDFSRTKPRLDARVAYQLQGVSYDGGSGSEVFHSLDASSQFALVLDRLFLDLFAVYDQTLNAATGKYSFNKLAQIGDRTDVAIVGASPNVALAIGENVTGEIRYSKTHVEYDAPAFEDDESTITFTLGNSNARSGGTWAVSYDRQRYDYQLSEEVEFQTFDAELGFWVAPTLRLFTTQGLESDYRLAFPGIAATGESPGLDDHYWYAGTDWRPNDRTTLTASTGERSFGRAGRFDWSYRTPRGGFKVGYREEPTTFLGEHLRSARLTGQLSPIDSLDGPDGNFFYLQKRLDVVFLLDRPRSNAALRVFREQRFDIVTAMNDGTNETEEFEGAEVSLRWRVNSKASLGLSSQNARRHSTLNAVDDEVRYVVLDYDRRLGRQGQLLVTVTRQRSEPRSGVSTNSYEENQVSFGIQRWFGDSATSTAPRRYSGYLNAARGP